MILKKAWFKPYTHTITVQDTTYHIYQLSVTPHNQLTIHSKHIWNLQSGKVDGVRYITRSKRLINLSSFHALPNPLYLFKNKPYKILKYINESDIIDISDQTEINGIPIFYSIEQLKEHLNGNV